MARVEPEGPDGGGSPGGDSCVDRVGYRRAISVEPVAHPVEGFPVAVVLQDDTGLATHSVSSAGQDIEFTLVDGTAVGHEIESFDRATGTVVAWVAIPVLSASVPTELTMYYGGNVVKSTPPVPWDSSFAAVWHLGEEALDEQDSATHADSVASHAAHQRGNKHVAGIIGRGQAFDGIDDQLWAEDLSAIDSATELTVSAWIRVTDLENDGVIAAKGYWRDEGDSFVLYYNQVGVSAQETRIVSIEIHDGEHVRTADAPPRSLPDSDWHQVAFTYVAGHPSGLRLYIDGVLAGSSGTRPNPGDTSQMSALAQTASTPLTIGGTADIDPDPAFSGFIDEVRISTVARSPAWIAAEYAAAANPSRFAVVGPEVPISSCAQ
jgi:biopolymer transport protein ExbB